MENALIQQELGRISASVSFKDSSLALRILDHIIGLHLSGAGDNEYKEVAIGQDIYEDPKYNPTTNPKLRQAMGRLRVTLHGYYEGEGNGNPLRISFPGEGYRPAFRLIPAEPKVQPESARPPDLSTEKLPPPVPPVSQQAGGTTINIHPTPQPNITIHPPNINITNVNNLPASNAPATHSAPQFVCSKCGGEGVSLRLILGPSRLWIAMYGPVRPEHVVKCTACGHEWHQRAVIL